LALKALGNEAEVTACFLESTKEEGDFIDMAVSTYSELSYYKALSLNELGKADEAQKLFTEIKKFAETKLLEKVQIDYFATSLPLLLVFDEDLQKRNKWEAKYLIALAELGLGNQTEAMAIFKEILEINAMHVSAHNQL